MSTTTIDSLPVEMLTEVLLRVRTPAALVHAAAASKSWRGAIATQQFLARYRKRHKSSTFLGLYVPREIAGPPSFHMPDSFRLGGDDARDLKGAALRAFDFGEVRRYQDHRRLHLGDAFILGRLGVHPDCRLLDCHNSRLLLTRGGEALEVRSPLARESVLLPFPPPDVVDPDCLEACLLQGHDKAAAAAFRVVCLQDRRAGRRRQARAVEYDSTRKSWQDHPWVTLDSNIEGKLEEVMHAGHRIFCKYKGLSQAALVLDTSNMQFTVLTLPGHQNFAIGESEDNVCCFVESIGCADPRLKVWHLDVDRLRWDLKKDIQMAQVLGVHVGYYRPRFISNGIAVVCSTTKHHHFVVDLNSCSMMEEFEFHGEFAYPMQMPWPPVFSSGLTAAGGFDQDGGFDDGGLAKLSAGDANADADDAMTGAGESDGIDDPSPGPSSMACFVSGNSTATPALMASTAAGSPSSPHQGRKRTGSRQSKGSPEAMCSRRRNWKPKPKYLEAMGQRRRHLFSTASKISDEVQIATSSCREASAASTAAGPPVEPEESLVWRSLNNDLLLQPPALASCPQQGRKWAGSRESAGSPKAMGPGRHSWKQKPKYLEAIFALRRRHSLSIASKISDKVQIPTSSCREASEASTAVVSAAECKLLFGGSGSTIEVTDSGKQPIIDVSITIAHSLVAPSASESAEQRGEPARGKGSPESGRGGRRKKMLNPKYLGGDWFV